MLVNALTREELRIAILDGNTLEHFQIEVSERGLIRGNIYRGTVANVQPALSAAFIDFGEEKHGFLPFHDIVEAQYHRKKEGARRIEQVLDKGKSILVQAGREAEGQKGAALTTNISLAGRYLVFTPWDEMRGVSRKVEDEDARRKLKEQIRDFKVPEGSGLIARTNAVGQTKTDLKRDLTAILRTWKTIQAEAKKGSGPALLHSDQDIVLRVMRDYVDAAIDEIILDDRSAYESAKAYADRFMAKSRTEIRLWEDRTPLFTKYDLEPKIEQIHARTVPLRNGGSIVIDHTEALVAIDVNSGRTKGSSQEETAVATNLEAAREVARQLRLRDIGGLIVVDFIDMRSRKYRNDVIKTLKDEMKGDKARSTVGSISANGLVEINRQRIQQALHLRTSRPCPTCDGSGRIASPEMIGLNLLRRIEGRALSGTLDTVRIALHPEIADAFQNGRRAQLASLESEFGIRVEVIASNRLHRPEQEIEWVERARSSAPLPSVPEKEKAVPPATTAPATTATEGETGGRKRRKRRRRKHSGEGPHEPLAQGGIEPSEMLEADETDLEPTIPDEIAPEEQGESAAGRKKRRRRRKRGGRGEVAAHTEPLPEGVEDEDFDAEPLPSAWIWDETGVSEEPEPLQRNDEDDDHFDDFEDTVATDAVITEPADEPGAVATKSARRRRRRRRGGRGSAAAGDTQVAEASSEADPTQEAAEAGGSDAEALEAPNAETQPEPGPAATPDAHAAGAKPAPRKRASRRKKPAAASPAADAGAETATPSAVAEDTSTAAPEEAPAKPKPARKSRPRRRKPAAAENSQSESGGE